MLHPHWSERASSGALLDSECSSFYGHAHVDERPLRMLRSMQHQHIGFGHYPLSLRHSAAVYVNANKNVARSLTTRCTHPAAGTHAHMSCRNFANNPFNAKFTHVGEQHG